MGLAGWVWKAGLWYFGGLSGWVWQVGFWQVRGLKGWVWKGWVWKGWVWLLGLAGWVWLVGLGLCSLEGGEGGVLGRSGLVAGGRPHGDGHKVGGGGGGPGSLLHSLGGGGGRRVQAPPGLQRLRHLGGE